MDIGFYVVNCDGSPKHNQIIDIMNKMIVDNPYDNIVLFNNKYQRIDANKKFPILHLSHAKYFRGTLIYFDMKSATLAKTFPGPSNQIFCCDTMDWRQQADSRAIVWQNIYRNMNVVSTDKSMCDILNICWDLKVKYIPELNHKELYSVIKEL